MRTGKSDLTIMSAEVSVGDNDGCSRVVLRGRLKLDHLLHEEPLSGSEGAGESLLWRAGFEPQVAEYRYPFGWEALLPARRWCGAKAYHTLSRLGSIFDQSVPP